MQGPKDKILVPMVALNFPVRKWMESHETQLSQFLARNSSGTGTVARGMVCACLILSTTVVWYQNIKYTCGRPHAHENKSNVVVSKGHTSHFRAATKFNSKTSLAGGDGCLENHLLAKGSALVSIANKRWECTIIVDFYAVQNEMQLMSAIVAKNISLTHVKRSTLGL